MIYKSGSVYKMRVDGVDGEIAVRQLVAFTTRAVSSEEEAHIRLDSTRNIERIFFPKKIVTIESFPLAASGKTDRKALERMAQKLTSPGGSAS